MVSQSKKIPKIVLLALDGSLYQHIEKRTALIIELILRTGATPLDIIGITPDQFSSQGRFTLISRKHKDSPQHTVTLSTQALLQAQKTDFSSISTRRIRQLLQQHTTTLGTTFNARELRNLYINYVAPHQGEVSQIKTTQRTTLNKEEIRRIKQIATTHKSTLFLLLETGIRVSEAVQITREHIKNQQLSITKDISYNKKPRIINISLSLQKALETKQKPLTVRRLEQVCKELSEQLGFIVTPNILRASAVQKLSTKLTQEQVQTQTGLHSKLLYTHGILSLREHTLPQTLLGVDSPEVADEEEGATAFMYRRSKLKDGGDTDE